MTDPIADMLTRIRNAMMVKKSEVVIPVSKLKVKIADILKDESYISSYNLNEKNQEMKVVLKYDNNGVPAISHLKRISKPGRRVYVNSNDIPSVLNNLGIAIISTSQGMMTGTQARAKKIGGEVICHIY